MFVSLCLLFCCLRGVIEKNAGDHRFAFPRFATMASACFAAAPRRPALAFSRVIVLVDFVGALRMSASIEATLINRFPVPRPPVSLTSRLSTKPELIQ
jgi:hypothetical protein